MCAYVCVCVYTGKDTFPRWRPRGIWLVKTPWSSLLLSPLIWMGRKMMRRGRGRKGKGWKQYTLHRDSIELDTWIRHCGNVTSQSHNQVINSVFFLSVLPPCGELSCCFLFKPAFHPISKDDNKRVITGQFCLYYCDWVTVITCTCQSCSSLTHTVDGSSWFQRTEFLCGYIWWKCQGQQRLYNTSVLCLNTYWQKWLWCFDHLKSIRASNDVRHKQD